MENITIGIPTYNGANRINDCLQSIYKWHDIPDGSNVRIVILDDGSPGLCREQMQDISSKYNISCIFHDKNYGISKSWNDLTNYYPDTEMMILLNDDILTAPFWITTMKYFIENNPQAGGVGWSFFFIIDHDIQRILNAKEPIVINRDPFTKIIRPDWEQPDKPGKMMVAVGCSFSYHIDKFKMVGGFDERMKSFYEESVKNDRLILIRDKETKLLTIVSIEDLFNRYYVGEDIVYPNDIEVISAILEKNTETASDFCLTDKEKLGDTPNRLKRRNQKITKGCYIQRGMWDDVRAIYRKKPQNDMVRVNSKMGETECTTCHSLIKRENNSLVEISPLDLNTDKDELSKVDIFPNMCETIISTLNLSTIVQDEIVDGHRRVVCDKQLFGEDRIWWLYKNGSDRNRYELNHNIKYSLPNIFPITASFVKLLAIYLAEGSISYTDTGRGQMIVCCGNDLSLIEDIEEAFIETFGIELSRSISRKDKFDDVYNIFTSQRIIIALFESLCGRYSKYKTFPSFILNTAPDIKKVFLEYLIKGDGFKYKDSSKKYHDKKYYREKYNNTYDYMDKYFMYTTQSKHLMSGISVLCLSLGIRFTVHYRQLVDAYTLRSGTKFYSPKRYINITPVEKSEYVYDISTAKTNMFADCLGNLLLHNSMFGTSLAKIGYPSYQIPYPYLYHCYDVDTEVLTYNGYRYFSDITYADKIATLNRHTIEYHNPKLIINKEYTGYMVMIQSKDFDLLVTPDHNMDVAIEPDGKFNLIPAYKLLDIKGKRIYFHSQTDIYEITDEHIYPVKYSGDVYCVTVPNHIIYVRRNGKSVWCGNCWSKTFQDNQEVLKPNIRMEESKMIYNRHFNVPREHWMDPFAYTDPLFMNRIEPGLVKYLDADLKERECVI